MTDTPETRSTRTRRRKSRRRDPSSEPGVLGTYLDALGDHALMTPRQELAKAMEIADLRRAYWRAILSHAPFAAAFTEVLENRLGDDIPADALEIYGSTSRALRDRGTRSNQDSHESAVQRLAEALVYPDAECHIADSISADLEAVLAGRGAGIGLAIRMPPKGSRRFSRYVQRVRNCRDTLCVARNEFVKANLRLVVKMAHRYGTNLLPLSDLIQEGNLGLMKAVDRFDHRRGFRFSTYASWWIRHAITRAMVNKGRTIRIPAHVNSTYFKVRKTRRRLEASLGRPATTGELAEALDMTRQQLDHVLGALQMRPLSLDAPRATGDDERTLRDILEDTEADLASDALEAAAVEGRLRRALAALKPLEVDILRQRFGLDGDPERTLAEVGEAHSLSRERIRQLQNRALAKLRRELEADGIEHGAGSSSALFAQR